MYIYISYIIARLLVCVVACFGVVFFVALVVGGGWVGIGPPICPLSRRRELFLSLRTFAKRKKRGHDLSIVPTLGTDAIRIIIQAPAAE